MSYLLLHSDFVLIIVKYFLSNWHGNWIFFKYAYMIHLFFSLTGLANFWSRVCSSLLFKMYFFLFMYYWFCYDLKESFNYNLFLPNQYNSCWFQIYIICVFLLSSYVSLYLYFLNYTVKWHMWNIHFIYNRNTYSMLKCFTYLKIYHTKYILYIFHLLMVYNCVYWTVNLFLMGKNFHFA